MRIVVDTREQTPLDFSPFPDCEVERGALATGDYSIKGLENIVGIERKSCSDRLGSLTHDRARFERELARLRSFALRAVVVEASWMQLAKGEYRSRMKPHSCLQSILGLGVRFEVPFLLVETHRAAAYTVYHLFRHFLKQREEELRVVLKNQVQVA